MIKLLWPAPLSHGDAVALLAPSSPAGRRILDRAVESIKFLGLVPRVYPSCYAKYGYLAGSDERRAEDLNAAFADKDIKGIFCLRGGYGAARILDMLDYDTIRQNPKVFCGYSDITALHTVLNEKCGFITFHSPMPNTGYHEMDKFSLHSLKNAIFSRHHNPSQLATSPNISSPNAPQSIRRNYSLENPPRHEPDTVSPGIATGILTGGNLSVLIGTLGSKYQADMRGKILFIEEVDEPQYKVDRMLTALSLAGVFDECSGVVLGSFSGCMGSNEGSIPLSEIFCDIFSKYRIPVMSGLAAGHTYPQITLPMGAQVTLNSAIKTITVL